MCRFPLRFTPSISLVIGTRELFSVPPVPRRLGRVLYFSHSLHYWFSPLSHSSVGHSLSVQFNSPHLIRGIYILCPNSLLCRIIVASAPEFYPQFIQLLPFPFLCLGPRLSAQRLPACSAAGLPSTSQPVQPLRSAPRQSALKLAVCFEVPAPPFPFQVPFVPNKSLLSGARHNCWCARVAIGSKPALIPDTKQGIN